jgi:hypothetical protein
LGEARNFGRELLGDWFRGIDRIDLAGAGIELEYGAIAFARGQRRSLYVDDEPIEHPTTQVFHDSSACAKGDRTVPNVTR